MFFYAVRKDQLEHLREVSFAIHRLRSPVSALFALYFTYRAFLFKGGITWGITKAKPRPFIDPSRHYHINIGMSYLKEIVKACTDFLNS